SLGCVREDVIVIGQLPCTRSWRNFHVLIVVKTSKRHSLKLRPLFLRRGLTFSLFLLSDHWTLSVRRREARDSRRYSRSYLIVPCCKMRPSVLKFLLSWRHPRYWLWMI